MMIQDGHVFVSRDIKITPTNHTQHKTTPIRPTHYKMAARTLDTKIIGTGLLAPPITKWRQVLSQEMLL